MRLKQNKEGETLDSKEITGFVHLTDTPQPTAVTNDPG